LTVRSISAQVVAAVVQNKLDAFLATRVGCPKAVASSVLLSLDVKEEQKRKRVRVLSFCHRLSQDEDKIKITAESISNE
jgi:hypothetical protein